MLPKIFSKNYNYDLIFSKVEIAKMLHKMRIYIYMDIQICHKY